MSTQVAAPGQRKKAAAPRQRKHGIAVRQERRAGVWFVVPAVVLMLVFLVIPVVMSFTLGFTNARLGAAASPEFVGFTNFTRALFNDPTFWDSLRNIMIFVIVVVPVQGGLGLLLALLINQKLRGITAFRIMFFLPVVTSMVVLAMLWRFMYQKDGLINSILGWNVDWLNNPSTALPAVIIMSIWQGVGFHMVIWLSGLQTISLDLYEAASLDGAGKWQQFRNVTLPGLRDDGRVRAHHHHDRGVLTVHPDRRHDQRRTVERDHDPRLPHHPNGVRAR